MRLAFDRSVLMAGQWSVAHPAAKMVHMPVGSFRTGVLGRKYQLVASFTSRNFHLFCIMPTTEHLMVNEEVNQIGQHFL